MSESRARVLEELEGRIDRLEDENSELISRVAELESSLDWVGRQRERAEAALIDIQGVNLEQRIIDATEGVVRRLASASGVDLPPQGTAGIPIQSDPYAPPGTVYFSRPADQVSWDTLDDYVDVPPDDFDPFDTATAQSLVDSGRDLPADVGTGYVADLLNADGDVVSTGTVVDGNFVPDDGADQSETDSPDRSPT